jgi:prepilin peptidase CpaA
MTLPTMLIATLPALLIAAALFDLTTYTIPNVLPAGMLLLFVLFLLAMALVGHALHWNEVSPHLIAGGLGLAVGMAMFAAGWIGGGDAKLFAMASLWLGWDDMFSYAVIASLLGGGLTLALLMLRKVPLPKPLAKQVWLLHLADPKSGVPYGVALSIAALFILPTTEIFRLAAAS